jgi:hypothetical protein
MLLAFVDNPQRHGGLTIYPIVSSDEPHLSYLLMTDALRQGVLAIEQNDSGEAPHLLAQNRGSQPVLILDCETVSGEKGSHTTNQSVLLGPGSVTRVPISCRDGSKWISETLQEQFAETLAHFPFQENQVGILAFLGRGLLGLDALGTPELYAQIHQRLVAGHLMTAAAAGKRGSAGLAADQSEIQALAMALEGAERVSAPCPGHGEYSTLRGEVSGGELRHNGHLVHLSVFPRGAAA